MPEFLSIYPCQWLEFRSLLQRHILVEPVNMAFCLMIYHYRYSSVKWIWNETMLIWNLWQKRGRGWFETCRHRNGEDHVMKTEIRVLYLQTTAKIFQQPPNTRKKCGKDTFSEPPLYKTQSLLIPCFSVFWLPELWENNIFYFAFWSLNLL